MVTLPMFFGIVLKRSAKSVPHEERLDAFRKTLPEEMRNDRSLFDQDDGLVAWSAGMSMQDVAIDIQRLTAAGLVEGEDFAVTAKLGRTGGKLPEWLAYDNERRMLALAVAM